jgi:D-serine deaminase-like pyridoxal phosphate-dependent protein
LENLNQISRAAKDADTTVCVVLEVDFGLHRAGVQPGEDALQLAIVACDLPGIHFSGLLGYEGFTMFEEDRKAPIKKTRSEMRELVDTSTLIQSAGIQVEIVRAGGTGTYDITGNIPGVTEIEAGSYVFMDTKYHKLGLEFKQSITVLSMVTSTQSVGRCIIDSGLMVLSTDNGAPELIKPDGFKLLGLHEEHGIVGVDP